MRRAFTARQSNRRLPVHIILDDVIERHTYTEDGDSVTRVSHLTLCGITARFTCVDHDGERESVGKWTALDHWPANRHDLCGTCSKGYEIRELAQVVPSTDAIIETLRLNSPRE